MVINTFFTHKMLSAFIKHLPGANPLVYEMNKILVIGPDLKLFGGVSFLLNSLCEKKLFEKNDYFVCGNKSLFGNFVDLKDYFIAIKGYKIIHLNPSFEYKSIIRDLVYAIIAVLYGKKVILSWMGWNEKVEKFFLERRPLKLILINILNQVDVNIVSNDLFKEKLKHLGVKKEVAVIFPPYEYELDEIAFNPQKNLPNIIKILFIARIERSKGIDKLIDIFEILVKHHPCSYELTIAGDGSELERIKELSRKKRLSIHYTGYIKGREKAKLLNEHHVFLFPSLHAEGIPLILAEAMKAGLFLVVSNAGGIASVLSERNGVVLEKNAAAVTYAEEIMKISNSDLSSKSRYNISFAENEFSPSMIVGQYMDIYRDLKYQYPMQQLF